MSTARSPGRGGAPAAATRLGLRNVELLARCRVAALARGAHALLERAEAGARRRPSQRLPTTSNRRETCAAADASLWRRRARLRRTAPQLAPRGAGRGHGAVLAATRHATDRPKTEEAAAGACRGASRRCAGRAPGQRHLLASLHGVLNHLQQAVHHGAHISLLQLRARSQLVDGIRLAQRLRPRGPGRERPARPGGRAAAHRVSVGRQKAHSRDGTKCGRRRAAYRRGAGVARSAAVLAVNAGVIRSMRLRSIEESGLKYGASR